MKIAKPSAPSGRLIICIREAMEAKQAADVQILDLRRISQAVVDYFVLCTAENEPHVEAIVNEIARCTYRSCQEKPWFIEGKATDRWVLMDYVDTVVHVFTADKREHYRLEELWGDAVALP